MSMKVIGSQAPMIICELHMTDEKQKIETYE